MNDKTMPVAAFTTLVALLALSTASAHAVSFTCKPLTDGTTDVGVSEMYVTAVNNRQQVVGYALSPAGGSFELGSAIWGKNRQAVHLNDETGDFAVLSSAYGINDAGQAVGVMWDRADRMHALTWGADGALTDLPGLPGGGDYAAATAINNRGRMVGHGRTTLPTGEVVMRAALWTDGVPKALGSLQKKGDSYATHINEGDVVVGYSSVAGPQSLVPVRWVGGKVAALPIPAGANGHAYNINKAGVIVGRVFPEGDTNGHAYAWHGDAGAAMGERPGFLSSWAGAINDGGVVVGSARFKDSDATTAMYWPTVDAKPVDLNTLVGQAGCVDAFGVKRTLTSAVDINEKGVVIANAYSDADGNLRTYSFRLTPN